MIIKVEFKSGWVYDPSGINSFSVAKLIEACKDKLGQKVAVVDRSLTDVVFEISDSVGLAEGNRLIQELVESAVCCQQDWTEVCAITAEGYEEPSPAIDESRASSSPPDLLASLHQLLAASEEAPCAAEELDGAQPAPSSPTPDSISQSVNVPAPTPTSVPVEETATKAASSCETSVLADIEHLVAAAERSAVRRLLSKDVAPPKHSSQRRFCSLLLLAAA